jgi:zinc transporter ZupT
MLVLTATLAAALAVTHLLAARLRFLDVVPRSRWLSFAGGTAVAYVFLHILPELSVHQRSFAQSLGLSDKAAETSVYLITLLGLAAFYGMERFVKGARARSREPAQGEARADRVFWLHTGSFALYNVLIGYLLLHREEPGLRSLVLYFVVMALHFLTNDFALRQDYRERYDRHGRWLLAAAALVGWALGAWLTLPEPTTGFLFAFLAGGIVLNVLKEELPRERESRFGPFAVGAAGYAALLIVAG